MARVRVGGRWLHSFTTVGGLRWRHGADGGCLEAAFTIGERASALAHPVFQRGVLVEVFHSVRRVWVGSLSEYNEASGEVFAVGLLEATRRLLSPTSDVDAALTASAPYRSFTYAGDAPVGVSSDAPQYLYDALGLAATAAGKRATVRADGLLRWETDPTAPTYYVTPGAGVVGRADEDYATQVTVLYVSSVSGTPPVADATATAVATDAAAEAAYGRSELFIDVRDRGLLTATEAGWIADGILAKFGARLSFTNSVTVSGDQLRSIGGQRVSLATVRAGEMVRFMGVRTPVGVGRASFDITVASTDYTDGSGQITLAPIGLVPRTLADVIASVPTIHTALNPAPGAGAVSAA